MSPFALKDTNTGVTVPCGKCYECRKRRVSMWSFRLMQEAKVSTTAYFVTLTYDNAHVPITAKMFMSLCKSDLQKFFKRLRKNSEAKIRYYAVGEYGGKTWRPHYHIAMFNATSNDIIRAWSLDNQSLGNIYFGEVSGASVGYTLKYISKCARVPQHANDDRVREFSLMSKGLGKNYLTDAMIAYHRKDIKGRMYCTLENGRKISMPRYYKGKLYTKLERTSAGAVLLKEKMVRDEEEKQKIIS